MIHIFTKTLKTINTSCPWERQPAVAVVRRLSHRLASTAAQLSIRPLVFTHITLPHCLPPTVSPGPSVSHSACPLPPFWSLCGSLPSAQCPTWHHTHTQTCFDSHGGQHMTMNERAGRPWLRQWTSVDPLHVTGDGGKCYQYGGTVISKMNVKVFSMQTKSQEVTQPAIKPPGLVGWDETCGVCI